MQRRKMKKRSCAVKFKLKEKLHIARKNLFNVNTFPGLLLVGVCTGLIVYFISNLIDGLSNNANPEAIYGSAFHGETVPSDTVSNDIVSSSTIPDSTVIDDVTHSYTDSNDSTSVNGTTPNDNEFHNIAPNGTAPKGTAPITVSATDEFEKTLEAIQKLSIGSYRDWVDKELGSPYAANIVEVTEKGRIRYFDKNMIDVDGEQIVEDDIVDKLLECVYILNDIITVTIYFDTPNESCRAFFVTLLKDTLDINIVIPETYSSLVSDKLLGEFAFTDICGEPSSVYGYVSQGVGRAFYGEEYYFAGNGNYQNFYFAVLDYGMVSSIAEFDSFLSIIQFDIAPMNDTGGLPASKLLTYQRYKFYPNTYGISSLNSHQTFSLLGAYTGFDSLLLRGWD